MSPSSSPLFCPKPQPDARLRLFCFPYAGVGASAYYPWGTALESVAEVWCIQLAGRETRRSEPPATELAPLADGLAAEISRAAGDEPFAVFGHSMGALLSYEVSMRLRRGYGKEPVWQAFSGYRAPHDSERRAPIHHLGDEAFLVALEQRYGEGIPPIIRSDPELLGMFLPVLRADLAVIESHRHRPDEPITWPISVFAGVEDPWVSADHIAAWHELAAAGFETRLFPGGHFYLREQKAALTGLIREKVAALDLEPNGHRPVDRPG